MHRFILVAIDYFTKWVEAVTLKSVTKKAVVDFVQSNLICQFEIPKLIITDNAANINSHLMKEVCQEFKIVHQNSTSYRRQANRAVEPAKKNIKIHRKMVQGSRQWHEKLPFALLGYRTIVRTSVGITPYLLVYGTEAIIPAKVEIPSFQIVAEAKIDDDEWVKTRLEQLSLIDEKRLAALCHGQLYQKRMARAYNKKVHPRKFEVDQQVLKCILSHQAEAKDIEGKRVDMAVNSDAIKRYYVLQIRLSSSEAFGTPKTLSYINVGFEMCTWNAENAKKKKKKKIGKISSSSNKIAATTKQHNINDNPRQHEPKQINRRYSTHCQFSNTQRKILNLDRTSSNLMLNFKQKDEEQ
ncbi:uncharacterized protein [Nicotiana sylvestris]|uniref:uncharacterized protein n=1 Tax=Nicotiana sylvestris TaxID=4096 RepID=UPI00388CA666